MSTGMVSGDVLHAQHDGGGRIPVRVFPTERDVRAIFPSWRTWIVWRLPDSAEPGSAVIDGA